MTTTPPSLQVLMTSDTVGGVWTYCVELARALAPRAVQVALATLGPPPSADQRSQVQRLPNVQLFDRPCLLEWMNDPWNDLQQAEGWLLQIAADVKADVVHLNHYVHGRSPWTCPCLIVGHSCVLSWYQAVRGETAGSQWDRYRHEVRQGLQGADHVVAPTSTMLRWLQRYYGPLPASEVILNGIEPPQAQEVAAKEAFVFTAGRAWDEAKNLEMVARIADRIDWPVRIASLPHPDGRDMAARGLQHLGRLDAPAMARMYGRASIYVLPARYEPFGLTPLEAAWRRCALVLGDIPTLREVWGDAAVFVSPDDADQLTAELSRLIGDSSFRHEMGRRAYRRAASLTADAMADAYLQLYSQLIARPRMHWPHKEAIQCTS